MIIIPVIVIQIGMLISAYRAMTTEAERLVIQRVGQDVFREALLSYWEGRCAATYL